MTPSSPTTFRSWTLAAAGSDAAVRRANGGFTATYSRPGMKSPPSFIPTPRRQRVSLARAEEFPHFTIWSRLRGGPTSVVRRTSPSAHRSFPTPRLRPWKAARRACLPITASSQWVPTFLQLSRSPARSKISPRNTARRWRLGRSAFSMRSRCAESLRSSAPMANLTRRTLVSSLAAQIFPVRSSREGDRGGTGRVGLRQAGSTLCSSGRALVADVARTGILREFLLRCGSSACGSVDTQDLALRPGTLLHGHGAAVTPCHPETGIDRGAPLRRSGARYRRVYRPSLLLHVRLCAAVRTQDGRNCAVHRQQASGAHHRGSNFCGSLLQKRTQSPHLPATRSDRLEPSIRWGAQSRRGSFRTEISH